MKNNFPPDFAEVSRSDKMFRSNKRWKMTDSNKDYADAMAALAQQDYETALELLRPLAERDVAWAQNSLGRLYKYGWGVTKNEAEGFKWLQKAADHSLALANQGDAEAQYDAGVFYARGDGVKQDYKKAFEWHLKAAEQGVPDAQMSLGQSYEGGYYPPIQKNLEEAYFWFSLAEKCGDPDAIHYMNRIAEHLSLEQKSAVKKRVENWKPKLASR